MIENDNFETIEFRDLNIEIKDEDIIDLFEKSKLF